MTVAITLRTQSPAGATPSSGAFTVKNSPLTISEMDLNLINLNIGKLDTFGGSITGNLTVGIDNTTAMTVNSLLSVTANASFGATSVVSINNTSDVTGSGTGGLRLAGGAYIAKDLFIDGGDILTGAASFNILNSPTTVSAFTGATTLTLGATSGTTAIRSSLVDFTNTTAIKVPVGTTAQRPTGQDGLVRYNTTIASFEGYATGAWSSLGGVKSVDGLTYITAETAPGASNDELEFYTANAAGTSTIKVGGWNVNRLLSNVNVSIAAVTESNSVGTGSIVTAGGIGVNKNIYIGGLGNIAGNLTVGGATSITGNFTVTVGNASFASTVDSTTTTSGAITTAGGIGVAKSLTIGGSVNIVSVTDSTSATTGTLVTAGGVGIAKNLTVGGATTVASAVDSTTTTTGAIVTAGGVGIAKNLTVGGGGNIVGNLTVGGNLVVNGATTTVNSTTVTLDDPVITLGGDTAPTVDDNKDRGVEFRWHNGSVAKTGFFGFDDSTGYFAFYPDATNSSEIFSGALGDIQATNFRGALIGNADTASKWQFPRVLTLTGDVSGTVTFDGSGDVSISTIIQPDSITLGADTTGQYASTLTATGIGLSVNTPNAADGTAYTITSNATSSNIGNTLVSRDAGGNFSAGTISSDLVGRVSYTVTGTNSAEILRGNMADNDQFRILIGGTATNSGFVEFATADDGTEPIFVRQYTGAFTNLVRTLTLLDGSGNTTFPGSITGSGSINITGSSTLNGRTVSDAIGTNTIVTRDGNGYSYFNYINSNTTNNENPSVSQVIVTNGSDSFYRKASISHLTSSLSGTASINITGNSGNTSSVSNATGGSYQWTGTNNFMSSNNTGVTGQAGVLVAYGNPSSNAATMSFHRPGQYAINMGLDTDNVFRLGGWSDGGNVFRWTSDTAGNFSARGQVSATQFNGSAAGLSGTAPINITGNAATASNGGVTSVNGQTGAVTVNVNHDTAQSSVTAIGSYIFAYATNTNNGAGFQAGQTIAGTALRYTGANGLESPFTPNAGTWRCHGYATPVPETPNTNSTVWQRIS